MGPNYHDAERELTSFDIDPLRCLAETWIERVHPFDQVDSTNSVAITHATAGGRPLAELFIAKRQTAGRGRGANQWWSAPGALTFSLLPKPLVLPQEQLPLVSLTVGTALCKSIEPLAGGQPVLLKWPNDVYLAGKKVAGVLIEIPPVRPPRVVIGVGLNVNNSLEEAPADVRERAISLVDVAPPSSRPLSLTDVLIACLVKIGEGLESLVQGDSALASEWRQKSLLTGRWVRIEAAGREVAGVCESIAPDGALLVRTAAGVEPCYGGVVAEFR